MITNNNRKRIACVIVTYNRKQLLKRCLEGVVSQTLKPSVVYITDNASTDGTIDSVKEWGYYECEKETIQFRYILNSKNEGGSGGFNLGMKTAFEEGKYDGIWVMDDDGRPDIKCLESLTSLLPNYDYIAPIVIDIENTASLSFKYKGSPLRKTMVEHANCNNIIDNYSCPFNGILYSSKLIKKIGYPKKEMFIWGDEINYDIRAKKAGFVPVTNVKAIHYHPVDKQKRERSLHSDVVIVEEPWKFYCFCRNSVYNKTVQYGKFKSLYFIFLIYAKYSVFLIKSRKYDLCRILNRAYFDGYRGDFSRLGEYKTF